MVVIVVGMGVIKVDFDCIMVLYFFVLEEFVMM